MKREKNNMSQVQKLLKLLQDKCIISKGEAKRMHNDYLYSLKSDNKRNRRKICKEKGCEKMVYKNCENSRCERHCYSLCDVHLICYKK